MAKKVKILIRVSDCMHNTPSDHLQGEEDERLVSLLERAASTGGSIDGAVVPVVVLCSEDERGQPPKNVSIAARTSEGQLHIQIGEDNVNRQDESAQTSRHEGGKESRQEEDNGHRRLWQVSIGTWIDKRRVNIR